MPLTEALGEPGSGKTMFLVKCAKYLSEIFPEKLLWANFPLYLPNARFLKLEEVDDIAHDCFIFITEAWSWLESRGSSFNEINKWLGDIEFESRKRDVEFYLDAQLDSTIDLRFRDLATYRVLCAVTPPFSMRPSYKPEFFTYRIFHHRKMVDAFILRASEAEKYYKLYESKYTVIRQRNPKLQAKLLLQQEPADFNKRVNEISKTVFDELQKQKITGATITHSVIKSIMADLETNDVYERKVYAKVRAMDTIKKSKQKKHRKKKD